VTERLTGHPEGWPAVARVPEATGGSFRRMPGGPNDPSPDRLQDAERVLAVSSPGLLDLVRSYSMRLAVADREGSDLGAALAGVEELSQIDLEPPTASMSALARRVKMLVKKLIGWYLRYFGRQINAFGESVVHLGSVLAERSERLEGRVERVESTVSELAGRVERLEGGGRTPGP
jgi:hypothetical protein